VLTGVGLLLTIVFAAALALKLGPAKLQYPATGLAKPPQPPQVLTWARRQSFRTGEEGGEQRHRKNLPSEFCPCGNHDKPHEDRCVVPFS
jgi:hypothetical protein